MSHLRHISLSNIQNLNYIILGVVLLLFTSKSNGQYILSKSDDFVEEFNVNTNNWDLYKSEQSNAEILDGDLILESYTELGTSRYIDVPFNNSEYELYSIIDVSNFENKGKAGMIYGFKNWENYSYFLISSGNSIYIGAVQEGVHMQFVSGMYCSNLTDGKNKISVTSEGGKDSFIVNGQVQFKTDKIDIYGNKIGFAISGINKLIASKISFSGSGLSNDSFLEDKDVKASGSGIIFNRKGYVVTNYHVVEGASNITIETFFNGISQTFNAEVVKYDVDNDLAILKITQGFSMPIQIDYAFSGSGRVSVGNNVFTIGYPMALSGMGKNAKFVDGRISSKTGYNNSINSYQTSVPVQPGNSGGPLFNENGELVGVINAKISGADNVSYAIKINYVKTLIDLLPNFVEYPKNNTLIGKSFEEQFNVLNNYVVFIKCR